MNDHFGDPLPRGAIARLGSVRWRHAAPVTCVAFSPNGKLIASSSWDNTVRLWNATTGSEIRRLRGHKGGVICLAFSADGKVLASGSDKHLEWRPDGTLVPSAEHCMIRLWEVETGALLRKFAGQKSKIASLALSPDGNMLASGTRDGTFFIWEFDREKPLHKIVGHKNFANCCVAVSPDNKTIASGGGDGLVRLWNAKSGKQIREFRAARGWVTAVAFSPKGTILATGNGYSDRDVKLWNPDNGKLLVHLGRQRDDVSSLAFSTNGEILVSCSQSHQTFEIWNVPHGNKVRTNWPKNTISGYQNVAVSPDGTKLATAHPDHTIRFWKTRSGQPLLRFAGHHDAVRDAQFTADSKHIVSGAHDYSWRVWDAATGKQIRAVKAPRGRLSHLLLTRKGELFGASGPYCYLWQLESGKFLRRLDLDDSVSSVLLTKKNKHLILGTWRKNKVEFRDWQTKKLGEHFLAGQGGVAALAVSPGEDLLATAGGWHADGSIRLWDMKTKRQLRQLTGHPQGTSDLAFSPDGKWLASAGEGNRNQGNHVKIWNPRTGGEIRRIASEANDQRRRRYWPSRRISVSPDGKLLATSGRSGAIHIWDTKSWKCIATRDGDQGGVHRLRFSPDGRLLLSAGSDTTILVWDVRRLGRGQ